MDVADLKTVTTSTVTDKRTENDSETVVRNTPPVQPTTTTTRTVAGNVVTTTVETVVETVEGTIPGTPAFDHIIYLNAERDNNITNDPLGETSGEGWRFSGGILTIDDNTGKMFRIQGAGTTSNRIVVQSGSNANIFLENVNIDVSGTAGACAFDMRGATVNLYLKGTNSLTSGEGRAGLEVPGGAAVVISSADGDHSLNGSLTATGGDSAAGIGGPGAGSPQGRAGAITINGGTIAAHGSGWDNLPLAGGAGIGGGNTNGPDGGGTITINGGKITAEGAYYGAGIGSGHDVDGAPNGGDDGTVITITGGDIDARGGSLAAAIGGAYLSDSGTITIAADTSDIQTAGTRTNINNGHLTITANGSNGHIDPDRADDIGHGNSGTVANVTYNPNLSRPSPKPAPALPTMGGEPERYEIQRDITRDITVETTREAYEVVDKPLAEIKQFYDAGGVFAVNDPQVITIYQGGGKSASVTLYGSDTMREAAKKINDAIAHGLGQGTYVDDMTKFCTISDGTAGTSESVHELKDDKEYATMLVRSAVPGGSGELTFSGSEDLLKTLGLSTIQGAEESEFTVTVTDAHTGKQVASAQTITGNTFYGAVTDNVDVRFDVLADIDVKWNEPEKRYEFSSGDETYTTYVHLADDTTTLQIGANEGEDMAIHCGIFNTSALGLNGVLMVSRESAARAVTVIDNAMERVSTQRAKLGAYQNRLEHTVGNLSVSSTNLTDAESRIRDADMAKEMLNFSKLNILLQSGTAMMAQTNQLPQAVLGLLR